QRNRREKETPLLSQVRRRVQMIFVVAALAAVGTATGCSASSGSAGGEKPLPAAPRGSKRGAKAIPVPLANYNKEYVQPYNTANADYAPFLAAGGGNGAGLQTSLKETFADHFKGEINGERGPEWSQPRVEYVDANSSIAAVTSCFSANDWQAVQTEPSSGPPKPTAGTQNP